MGITITHFRKSSLEVGVWKKLKFFYKKDGEDFFRIGGQPGVQMSSEEMMCREVAGTAIKLDDPIEISSTDKILWVDHEGIVWFATIKNPIQDKTKKRITRYSPDPVPAV